MKRARQYFVKQTIARQIQIVLTLTILAFWHLYVSFELVYQAKEKMAGLEQALEAQLQQFVADNQAAMDLFDYETVRANAVHIVFPYPPTGFSVSSPFGERIFQSGETPAPSEGGFKFGKMEFESIFRPLDGQFYFKKDFALRGSRSGTIEGGLTLRPVAYQIFWTLVIRYLFGLLFIAGILGIVLWWSKRLTQPLEMFVTALTRSGGTSLVEGPFLGASMDMTQLSTAYNESVNRQHRLQDRLISVEKDATRTTLARRLVHDLRSPIHGIRTAMRYFKTLRIEDPSFSTNYDLLELSSARLTSMADSLLMDHRNTESKDRLIPVRPLMDEIVGTYEASERDSDLKFVRRFSEERLVILGNPDLLRRAIGNIVQNGIEAMPQGGTLTISVVGFAQTVKITIEDQGSGMSQEQLARVLSGNHSTKIGGHGIGLAASRQTIEAHQGFFNMRSSPGKGSVVEIDLPRTEQAYREPDVLDLRVGPSGVLVVEDDPIFQKQWKDVFSSKGVPHHLCSDFDAVAATLQSEKFDAAVVDFNLPGSKNGIAVAELLKQHGIQEIVLCSWDYWKPFVKREALALGLRVFPKPIPEVRIGS